MNNNNSNNSSLLYSHELTKQKLELTKEKASKNNDSPIHVEVVAINFFVQNRRKIKNRTELLNTQQIKDS